MNKIEEGFLRLCLRPRVTCDLPGRLRLCFEKYRLLPEAAAPYLHYIRDVLELLPGVLQAEINPRIGTALIRYEGRQLNEDYCCYYDAPVLVIASNEPTRTGGMDCACALQNMFLAAHSLGIASCWINQLSYTCDAPEVRAYLKRLGVPTVHKVYGCAALGYNGGKEPAAHPRKEGLVSYAE